MSSNSKLDASSVPSGVLDVLSRLWEAGYEAYLVGGGVRDRMLGRAATDWDLASSAQPSEVLALFERVVPTGIAHGTVTVVDDVSTYEVTTFRVESDYTDGRRPDAVEFTRSIEDDLSRRDFTINAMAWNPVKGVLIDPYGGKGDLDRRLVRAVGRAEERLGEDGLRSMRAIRFACVLGFELDDDLFTAIGVTLDTFRQVSAERVEVELRKTLLSGQPGRGVRLLAETGLLGIVDPAFLELANGALETVTEQLDRSTECPKVRYAVLLSLLTEGEPAQRRVLNGLKVSNRFKKSVQHLIQFSGDHAVTENDAPDLRRWVAKVGRDEFGAVVGLLEARWSDFDRTALMEQVDACQALSGPHSIKELAVSGKELMTTLGLRPSPRLGQILGELLEACWVTPELNTHDGLLAEARRRTAGGSEDGAL